ncbi:hypothetical protein BT93_H3269 [Corymbia citriodora subsp. variegata]|nr:hypothetical protein BT93_H3269 [Corymbia citriodora subsp. variegata]
MVCHGDPLIQTVFELHEKISSLDSLKPCRDVNTLLSQLVLTCTPHSHHHIDVARLCNKAQEMRSDLIRLCGEAEGQLESHFATILGSFDRPIENLEIFPYYKNYLKLAQLEFTLLTQHCTGVPNRVAFVGSGPLPLTSIVLASNHLTTTSFHNYDIDPSANSKAIRLISSDPDLSKRVLFHTCDVFKVTKELKEYDVVLLAALVGMNKEDKARAIEHLGRYMKSGAILMVRSAHGARAFLYPVVDVHSDLGGFEVLSVFHPKDEVVNSVILARKC